MNAPDLSGAVVAVTGAGGRLGHVLLQHLLAADARVIALDARPLDPIPPGTLDMVVDLTDEHALAAAFARAEAETGALTALVHTVGMWDGRPLTETTSEQWRQVLDVNLTSTFLCFREAARRMDGVGRLVTLASQQGADRGVAQQAAYSASKAGVVRLVEAAAAEFEGHITATAIAPSMILYGDEDEGTTGVAADDVAALCTYLCGPGGAIHNGAVLKAYGTRV